MGRACSVNGGERNAYRILVRKPEGRNNQKDLYLGGRKILEWILEIGWGGMDCNDLAQDRDQLRALVKTVPNLRVP
jgi:hypothetical protein